MNKSASDRTRDLDTPPRREPRRAPGLLVLATIVIVGMGIPAYLKWMVPRLEVQRDEILANAPTEPIGQLQRWFEFGQPLIHNALIAARFSNHMPWFVTHVVAAAEEGSPPEIYGIDFEHLSPEAIVNHGLTVRVELPAPTLLARDVLTGDKALGVPVFQPEPDLPDGCELARARLERYLEAVREGLERDIEGARLEVRVGDR